VLQLAEPGDREQVIAILNGETDDRERALQPFFERYAAFAYAYDVARRFTQRAKNRLAGLTESAAGCKLEMLCEFVISRSR
jgi:geranylgeranyl pyrophosphate synthase